VEVGPKIGTDVPMSAAVVAERLVRREETRTRSRMLAYDRVAREVGRTGEWLRKLIRTGTARVDGEIERRLDALLTRGLEADIANLQAELDVARLRRQPIDQQHIPEIEAHLAKARALLSGSAQ
jgi:hypothetical protein